MVSLTRPVRQGLATLVVVLVSIAPTVYVGVTAWRINRPGHVRDVEVELGRRLGMHVGLREVGYPRPGEVRVRGLVLRREESRGGRLAELARAEVVRVERIDRELMLRLDDPSFRADSPAEGLEQLAGLLAQSGRLPYERVSFSASSCRLDLGTDGQAAAVRDMAGTCVIEPEGATLKLSFAAPGSGPLTRCEAVVSRDRRAEPVATTVTVKIVEGPPLPAGALGAFFDVPEWLGPRATVEGELVVKKAGTGGFEAAFAGAFHDVDLAALVDKRFPGRHASGRARVAITNARWGDRGAQGPGWIEAKGELTADAGSIDAGFLEALAREMRFRPSSRLKARTAHGGDVDFRVLGLAFAINPAGEIHLQGSLGPEFAPDVVLAGATAPLLSAPLGAASVHGLIKTLFPTAAADSSVLVPLTAQSRALFALPVAPGPTQGRATSVDGN